MEIKKEKNKVESMLFSICLLSNRIWLVSLTVAGFLFISICASGNEDNELVKQFDELAYSLQCSDHAAFEAYRFLKSFVGKINVEYGASLTLIEAGELVKIHLNEFGFSNEIKGSLIKFIEFLSVVESPLQNEYPPGACFVDLRFWNWSICSPFFKGRDMYAPSIPLAIAEDPPDGVIFGLVEIFAGALLCVIPLEITWAIGGTLIGDGLIRAVGATMEVSGKRKSEEEISETTNSKTIDQISSVNCKIGAWRRRMLLLTM